MRSLKPGMQGLRSCARSLLVSGAALFLAPFEAASADWDLAKLSAEEVDVSRFAETGDLAPNGLPDGRVARQDAGDILAAWYEEPTGRYRHAILGDGIEAGTLVVQMGDQSIRRVVLDQDEVFEDRTPRLADLDGDGRTEVITILASQFTGGSIAVYGLDATGTLVQKARAGQIGRPNRWLNIAALEDLAGRGDRQIAYVETPHIGGTLKLYAYENNELVKLSELFGFSNHAIGAREQRLSATVDVDGDGVLDLFVPTANRRGIRVVGAHGGDLTQRALIPLPARVSRAILVDRDSQGTLSLLLGLDDGGFYHVVRR